MTGVLDQLRAVHNGNLDLARRAKVDVPEYGWTLFFAPLTVADRTAIRRGVNPDDDMEMMISALVHMAQKEDGTRFFEDSPALRAELNRMPVGTLVRITGASKAQAVAITADTAKNA